MQSCFAPASIEGIGFAEPEAIAAALADAGAGALLAAAVVAAAVAVAVVAAGAAGLGVGFGADALDALGVLSFSSQPATAPARIPVMAAATNVPVTLVTLMSFLRDGCASIDRADQVRTARTMVSSAHARRAWALYALVLALALVLASSGCVSPPASDPPRATHATCSRAPSASPFELIVLGSGGPTAFGRAASSYVVRIDGVARILIDAGPGAFVRIGEMGIDTSALDTILLTHLHVDHTSDLPAIVKSRDLSTDEGVTFRIFGPSGRGPYPSTTTFVARLFGPDGAFAYLPSFRNALDLEAHDLPLDANDPPRVVVADPAWRVTSIVTDHGDVPSIAFRIERAGHSVVFSGDLASKTENLARLAQGADVLVYDAVVRDLPAGPTGLYALHTPPRRIGEVAATARVRSVVLAHISPAVDSARDEVVASIRARYSGPVRFAEDCLRIDVKWNAARPSGPNSPPHL